jgi:hypothetical protein
MVEVRMDLFVTIAVSKKARRPLYGMGLRLMLWSLPAAIPLFSAYFWRIGTRTELER